VTGDICVPNEKGSGGEGGNAATDEIGCRIVVLDRSMVFRKESFQLLRPPAPEEGASIDYSVVQFLTNIRRLWIALSGFRQSGRIVPQFSNAGNDLPID
jgi:hypothetical protein